MMLAIRSLHVDIEGGRGGSSRSLYQLLSRLDPERIQPMVVHRQSGPLEDWYRELGIPTRRVSEIGTYVPRHRNSAKIFLASVPRLLRTRRATERLLDIIREQDIQIIHLNYEGLFLLARQLRRKTSLPIICHVRAHWPINGWSRWMSRILFRSVDHLIFISPQEEERARALGFNSSQCGTVAWNIAPAPWERQPLPSSPEAVYLGNIEWSKGVDRLLDIAAALNALEAPPLSLAIYGESRQDRQNYINRMQDRIDTEKLGSRIEFRGFTAEPERVLSNAFALLRPSRENDPWGRDVIEATAFGVPVLATGKFEGVVKHGITGFLFDPFKAEDVARTLIDLLHDQELWNRTSAAARKHGREIFGGSAQVKKLTELFEQYARKRA